MIGFQNAFGNLCTCEHSRDIHAVKVLQPVIVELQDDIVAAFLMKAGELHACQIREAMSFSGNQISIDNGDSHGAVTSAIRRSAIAQ